jgi:hypothetical protein
VSTEYSLYPSLSGSALDAPSKTPLKRPLYAHLSGLHLLQLQHICHVVFDLHFDAAGASGRGSQFLWVVVLFVVVQLFVPELFVERLVWWQFDFQLQCAPHPVFEWGDPSGADSA